MRNKLQQIISDIPSGSLGYNLSRLKTIVEDNHMGQEMQELEAVSSTYGYMKQFMMNGVEDSQRGMLYKELKRKSYELVKKLFCRIILQENISLRQAMESAKNTPMAWEDMEQRLCWFESEIAIACLDASGGQRIRDINEQLLAYRKTLFNSIYSTVFITPGQEKALAAYLVSPVSAGLTDSRLIISALMLAQQMVFDVRRFQILIETACSSIHEETRQQALIAIVLARPSTLDMIIYKAEIECGINRLASLENIRQELFELQLQMLLCTDTEKTRRTINSEIMPTLRDNAMRMDFGDGKTDKELLDELLHPDKDEKAMERMESAIERMKSLQESGADVFFSGFAQAKRFSFFYTLMNWFMPFSMDHPQIVSLNTGGISDDTIERLLQMQNFCDSDKYSFYITLSSVVHQIPKQFTDILQKGEVPLTEMPQMAHDGAYKRRMYLQDLYRFFNLYSAKQDFKNPFAKAEDFVFFNWQPVADMMKGTKYPLGVGRQLLKRDYFTALNPQLDQVSDELNLSYLKLKAMSEFRQGHHLSAQYWFDKALIMEPDNVVLLGKMAENALLMDDFMRAKQLYGQILLLKAGDSSREECAYALSCLNLKDADEAMKMLFKLVYNYPDRDDIRMLLAWGHMLKGHFSEAADIYAGAEACSEDDDMMRRMIALWMSKRNSEALIAGREYISAFNASHEELLEALRKEIRRCGITMDEADACILADIVGDNML